MFHPKSDYHNDQELNTQQKTSRVKIEKNNKKNKENNIKDPGKGKECWINIHSDGKYKTIDDSLTLYFVYLFFSISQVYIIHTTCLMTKN